MSKPQTEINKESYYKDVYFLYEIISSLKNIEDVKKFFRDILTTSEIRMIRRRWFIGRLLMQGLKVREVARQAQVSTQTVMRIKKILMEGSGGLNNALKKISDKEKKRLPEKEEIFKPKDREGTRYLFG